MVQANFRIWDLIELEQMLTGSKLMSLNLGWKTLYQGLLREKGFFPAVHVNYASFIYDHFCKVWQSWWAASGGKEEPLKKCSRFLSLTAVNSSLWLLCNDVTVDQMPEKIGSRKHENHNLFDWTNKPPIHFYGGDGKHSFLSFMQMTWTRKIYFSMFSVNLFTLAFFSL